MGYVYKLFSMTDDLNLIENLIAILFIKLFFRFILILVISPRKFL